METVINDLEIACLVHVFSFLGSKDCGRAACVHPLWNTVLAEDVIWRPHLARDFSAGAPVNPDETAATSFRAAYAAWQSTYADVAGPLFSRVLACWASIKTWLAANSPQVLETLNPGATAEELAAAEHQLGCSLPAAMRCIYRVHNGQDMRLDNRSPSAAGGGGAGGAATAAPPRLLLGLFGCLMFYEHITSNALQPLTNVVKYTQLLRSARPMGARHPHLARNHVVFACSFRVVDKLCVINCDSGGVYLKTSPGRDWQLSPVEDSQPGACDGLLRWMEEYASRLSAGWYGGCEGDSSLTGADISLAGAISLFPRCFPAAATAITRGVQVSWSSVLVPQECRQNRLLFAYSVRFSLLTPQEQQATLERLSKEQQHWQQLQLQHHQRHQQHHQQHQPQQHQPQQLQNQHPQHQQQQSSLAAATTTSSQAVPHAPAQGSVSPAPPAAHRSLGRPAADLANSKKQSIVIGPCDAAAGAACVPDALSTEPAWAAAAAGALVGGSSSNSASVGAHDAPAGAVDDVAALAAGSSGGRPSSAGGGGSSGGTGGGSTGGGGSTAPGAAALSAAPSSCQLETRNWSILDAAGSVIDNVAGEGVVGLYPLLVPGGDVFSYASCTPFMVDMAATAAAAAPGAAEAPAAEAPAAAAAAASEDATWPGQLAGGVLGGMEGSFRFVEGSLMQRSGGPGIAVRCPRLVFAVPDFIF